MPAVLDTPYVASPEVSLAVRRASSQTLTTLFDLIGSFQDAVPAEEDALIVATVTDLLQAGRIRLLPQLMGNNDLETHDSRPR